MCFGCSKEPSHRDGSFEYPQHMFWLRKKNKNLFCTLIGGGGGLNYYVVPEATSRGRRINTESQLKQSCTVAPAKARLKSFLLVICPIDTIVLVTDVPMLAPITIGMASFTVNTEKIRNILDTLSVKKQLVSIKF